MKIQSLIFWISSPKNLFPNFDAKIQMPFRKLDNFGVKIRMRHFYWFWNNVPSYNFPKVAKIYWFRGQTSWTLSHKLTPWSKKPVFKRAISMMDEFSVFPITSVRYRVEVCGILMSNESRSSDNTVEQCDKIIHFPLSFAYLHHHKIQSTTLP